MGRCLLTGCSNPFQAAMKRNRFQFSNFLLFQHSFFSCLSSDIFFFFNSKIYFMRRRTQPQTSIKVNRIFNQLFGCHAAYLFLNSFRQVISIHQKFRFDFSHKITVQLTTISHFNDQFCVGDSIDRNR